MRLRSDFKVRADAGLFAFIGFSHAEDMSGSASWRIANYHHTPGQLTKADHAHLAIILSCVLDLKGEAGKDSGGVFEVEAALIKRLLALGGIVANAHWLL